MYSLLSRSPPNYVARTAGWETQLHILNITEVFIAIWDQGRERKMKLKEDEEPERKGREINEKNIRGRKKK
jgi:hypothetical protein